jgi:hypothetical protein
LVIVAVFVGNWRNNEDKNATNMESTMSYSQSADSTTTDSNTTAQKDKPHFAIGISNLIIFGGLVVALVVVRHKKALGTSDADRKTKGD